MKNLLLAAVLAVAAGAASADALFPNETVTVRSTFCRSAASAEEVLFAYEASGVAASNAIMRQMVDAGECVVLTLLEVIPLELVYETADNYARIIKVGSPEKPGEVIYMLTVRFTIGGPDA